MDWFVFFILRTIKFLKCDREKFKKMLKIVWYKLCLIPVKQGGMKKLVIGICLLSSMGFAQLNDPVTQIEHNGTVYQVDPNLTARGLDFMNDSGIMDMMELKLYQSTDSIPYFSIHEKNSVSKNSKLIMGIPYLSCGIGYRYYELIEEQPSFLLFREVGYFTEGNVGKVIVLNKVRS